MSNNTSSSTIFHTAWVEPFAMRVIRLVVFGFIVFSSLFGNGLVVKTVLSLPRGRIPFTYILVMNLAVAELLNTILLPFIITYDEMVTWIFGQFGCQLISPLQNVASSVITSTVAAIAFCRCCFILFPRKANRFHNHRYAISLISLLWLIAIALNLQLFLFNTKVDSLTSQGKYWCITLLPGDTTKTFPSAPYKAWIIVQIGISFAINSTIMLISYGVVIFRLRGSKTYKNNNVEGEVNQTMTIEMPSQTTETQITTATQMTTGMQPTDEQQQSGRTIRNEADDSKANVERAYTQSMENDVFRMFYVIVVIFVVCYFPYQIVFLMEYFQVISLHWVYLPVVRKYLLLLICLPSALHPLCYGLMCRFYAKAFSKIILCQ